ncbi:hypothetical protein ACJ72_06468 [Emergomyces africanus]|uniref:Protein kinase domain-containing protein n=1 Tax=Emergomyces africanus TaxID=1955775 RepID=A0A1B7NQW9_9EURO|nr:hypothetical protein ACJ72_06468 [Emergomyces africanus]
MADNEIQKLRQLIEEERRGRQKAEKAQQESEKAQQELEKAQQELEKAQQASDNALQAIQEEIRPSTLFEYLDACHTCLYTGLVPGNVNNSTQGRADNAEGKLRPDRIREWLPFADAQTEIWDRLLNDDDEGFTLQRQFDSLHGMMTLGKNTRKNIHSELDLHYFQRDAITMPVSSIMKVIWENERLRQLFGLQGPVSFENHANTLTDGEADEGVVARPSKLRKGTGGAATPTNPATARPLADEFCIYNKGDNVKIPALIGELKPPHKFPLKIINSVLENREEKKAKKIEMELDGLVERELGEPQETRDCRLVAAVITQAFSYMIKAGLEYGYVSTGEAFIFLHFEAHDPGTLYYYLSVPQSDVEGDTGFRGNASAGVNKLHLTAVGQVLAFLLQAIGTTPHDQKWQEWAASQLSVWVVTEEDLYVSSPETNKRPPSPYRPLKSAQIFMRHSPVRTRSRSTCKPTSALQKSSDEDDNDSESDSHSPSPRPRRPANIMVVMPPPPNRASSYKGPVCKDGTRRYCTQKCLLGLLYGGPLDKACPNVKEHGADVHMIDHSTFISLLLAQILQEIIDPWTDPLGCESLHRNGARGALFEVILFQYGYTLVGKGFPPEFGHYLRHEKALYDQLQPIQGVHVPVCLGTIDVSKRPLFYDGIADIPHFLLLAHAGTEVSRCDVAEAQIVSAASESLNAIHALGVLHHDAETRNLFWSEEGKNVLVIDFERSEILHSVRVKLGQTSPNQKRKRAGKGMSDEKQVDVRQKQTDTKFKRELNAMVMYMERYLNA